MFAGVCKRTLMFTVSSTGTLVRSRREPSDVTMYSGYTMASQCDGDGECDRHTNLHREVVNQLRSFNSRP